MRTRTPQFPPEPILSRAAEGAPRPARPSIPRLVIAYLRRRRDGVPSGALTLDTRPLVIRALVHELRAGESDWTYDVTGAGDTLRATASLRTDAHCLTIAWKASDGHRIRLSVDPTNVGNAAALARPTVLAALWGDAHDQMFRYCSWQHLNYVRGWATRGPSLLRTLGPAGHALRKPHAWATT